MRQLTSLLRSGTAHIRPQSDRIDGMAHRLEHGLPQLCGMNRSVLSTTLWTIACAALATPAVAQVSAEPWFRGGTLMFTIEGGGAAFTDFHRTQARPVAEHAGLVDFRSRVSARTSGSVGAWATYWVRDGLGLRAGTAWVPSGFTVWNEESAERAVQPDADAEPERYASLDIWMANAALVIRVPHSFGRVSPYGILGGGMVRYSTGDQEALPPEARPRFEDGQWQTVAAFFGVGAAIPLQRGNLLLTFELTNHLTRAPLADSNGEMFDLAGVTMQIDPNPATAHSDEVGTTSHLRLAFGLTLPVR
jgi:hypothetical protein